MSASLPHVPADTVLRHVSAPLAAPKTHPRSTRKAAGLTIRPTLVAFVRQFLVALPAAAVLTLLCLSGTWNGSIAAAQQDSSQPAAPSPAKKIPRIGVLLFSTPERDANFGVFVRHLRELGYVEGRNVVFEYRYADARPERLPALAAELAATAPDVIVAIGGDVAPVAKRASPPSIPIVALTSADPVRGGLVASLGRPGGNVTGVTLLATDLAAKRVQLLAEALPDARRVAFFWNPDHADDEWAETRRAATQLGIDLVPLPVRRPEDLAGAFDAAVRAEPQAVIVVASRLTNLSARRILDFAAEHRLPVVAGWGPWSRGGGLLTYGPNVDESARRMADHVGRILNGADPAELPVEQPTAFELVINLKTARALGLEIPPTLLARADEVIE
jgi:putative tryptophan/tyrosine transport system substrate-binding protein